MSTRKTLSWRRAAMVAAAFALAVGLMGCDQKPQGEDLGRQLYQNCAYCHGEDGGGMEQYWAPAIASLPEWYIEAQLHKFRDGARGDHPDDITGLRMRPMARTLTSAEEVSAVAAFAAALPDIDPAPTLEGGDASRGQALFGPCVACHGEDGTGKQEVNAPPLDQASDWYLLAQFHKFKAGIRGADPEDVTGGQMRPMVAGLTDEQAMKDVIAYIQSL